MGGSTASRRRHELALAAVALALVAPGCLGILEEAAGLLPRAGPVLPTSACEIGGACNALVSSGESRADEPSVAVSPSDPMHVVVGYHTRDAPGGDVWTAVAVSRDGGATWTRSLLPGHPGDTRGPSALTGYTVAGDPALAFGPSGELYYAGIAFHRTLSNVALFVARSDDGGDTWPRITFVQRGVSSVVFNDKEYVAVDPATGTVVVSWTEFRFLPTTLLGVPVDPVAKGDIRVSRSTDGGLSWSAPVTLSERPFNQGSIPLVAPDGSVHVAWLEYLDASDGDGEAPARVVVASSTDGGATFGPLAHVSDVFPLESPLENTRFRVNSMPTFAVDASDSPRRGALFVAWADARDGNGDVLFARSEDGGATWTPAAPVNEDLTRRDQFMPWMVVDARGAVHVLYLDRSEDPENTAYHARLATSTDGGARWESQRLTDEPSDDRVARPPPGALGQEGSTFIGDYSGLAASGDRIYPVWPDLRRSAGEERRVDVLTTVLELR